jgi:CheY-like chemotaxis protein
MLRSGRLDDETFGTAIEIIERNARTQQHIVDDILDVSRVITGKLRFDPEPTDLRAVVGAAVDAVRPAAAAKKIKLLTDYDPRARPVTGDPSRLQQVVWNLLSNAVKFTPVGGEVRARVEQAEGRARLTVADTGLGIKPDFLPFVFDRFRQGDQSTTRAFGGLGLGLALVRHLVELHGGTVSAESEGEGKGSTFTVELPNMETRAEGGLPFRAEVVVEPVVRLSPSEILRGTRVLVVDDEQDALDLIRVILEQRGATVVTALSAAAALEALGAGGADVIVCDIGMPGEDGYGLIRKVRALGDGGATPAIALTAYAAESDRAQALAAGFQLHVPKPVEPENLVRVVAGVLRKGEKV